MKKSDILITLIFFILFIGQLSAQKRICGTMDYLEFSKSKDSSLDQKMQHNENILQQMILNQSENSISNIITIPVVFHIVYNNTNENISDLQIQSQIDILNEDFRRTNADASNTPSAFQSLAADTEIEFCLANTDPNGNSTSGITRTQTSQSSFSTNDGVKFSSSGGFDAWNTSEYLNFWVCDISGGILGYAQFPGGTANTDGVVCDYAYVGNIGTATSPYNLGRTATHEVGHWLNLRHIWGDSNCGDDYCNDTPEHSGSNYGCPNYPSTSSCNGNGSNGDMFMNYMDYTDDNCMNMFTQDQKNRMIASINTSRSGLLTSNGCTNTDYGCTDAAAFNYSSIAVIDDGSCCFVSGCTDPLAVNYDPLACYDNGSCTAPILGCTNQTASNYDPNANTVIASGGALDNTFNSGSYFNGDQHLNFDASKECVIKSAIIYSEAINSISFELRDNNGTVIDDTTLNVVAGQQTINLNFSVPIANNLQLGVAPGALTNLGLYRNNAGATYPYDIASAINITSSSASVSGYYYFYYNIEVETPCLNATQATYDCDGLGNCSDPGNGNGAYSSLNVCQTNCIIPVTYDCDGLGNCSDPGNGNGAYSSLNVCQTNCIIPVTYDCDGLGSCSDPGNGNGAYSSLNACQTNCIIPVTYDCDGLGNCSDPGNGNGAYSSLNACQTNCIIPVTYDCDGQGNCIDPGNGNGTYTSILACQAECVSTSIPESELSNISIFPNPNYGYFTIKFSSLIAQDLRIKITNAIGEIVFIDKSENYIGEYKSQINLKDYSNGIYFLEIETHKGTANKKIVLY
jgi:hypothetical protein